VAAVSNEDAFLGFSSGTYWYHSGALDKITTSVPSVMAANSDGTLFASYTSGTWEYHPAAGWTQIYSEPAKDLVVITYGHFVGTFSDGTWEWGQTTGWKQLTPNEADHLGGVYTSNGVTLIGSYGSTAGGTWIYENGAWREITTAQASLVD
jgi:hypothetical protein